MKMTTTTWTEPANAPVIETETEPVGWALPWPIIGLLAAAGLGIMVSLVGGG